MGGGQLELDDHPHLTLLPLSSSSSTDFGSPLPLGRGRETMETVTDFIFLGSKTTADGDCSHEIKRCLLLERKAVTNLDSILKSSTDITLPTNVHIVKVMVFSSSHVWMCKLDHKEG